MKTQFGRIWDSRTVADPDPGIALIAIDRVFLHGRTGVAALKSMAKAMTVVRGEAEIYFHTGGPFEWDSCAPVAVVSTHGLHVSRANESPLI